MGEAMNSDENVPITTPRIMANEKLRMLSPPRKKMMTSTINVDEPVNNVRVSVEFNESLNRRNVPRLGYR